MNVFCAAPGDRLDYAIEHGRYLRPIFKAMRDSGCSLVSRSTRDDGDARPLREPPSLHLVSEAREDLGARSDEGHPGLPTPLREGRVLREEAVAGVDGVASRFLRKRDERLRVEIRSDAAAGQRAGFVGLPDV